MSMCLSVPRDLANRWADMFLLYNEALQWSGPKKFFKIPPLSQKKLHLEQNLPSPSIIFVFFKLKLKVKGRYSPLLPSSKCL